MSAKVSLWSGLVVLLAGCAAGDPSLGPAGGYQELKLSADSYRISMRSNTYPLPQRVESAALLRASELTLQSGYDQFIVVSRPSIDDPSGDIVIRMVAQDDDAYIMALDAKFLDQELRPRLAQ